MTTIVLGTFVFFSGHTALWFLRSAVLFMRGPAAFSRMASSMVESSGIPAVASVQDGHHPLAVPPLASGIHVHRPRRVAAFQVRQPRLLNRVVSISPDDQAQLEREPAVVPQRRKHQPDVSMLQRCRQRKRPIGTRPHACVRG